MNSQLVSVVMCTYNGSRFVGEQLESILRQTHSNLEIIIVDDASGDNTFDIVCDYAKKDPRIHAFRNETNIGFNLNFNKACEKTSAAFIAIADQDDIWAPSKIEILLQTIKDDPGMLLVHCISARFEKFGEFHLKSHGLVNYTAGDDTRNFFLSNFISGHNMLLRKALLDISLPFPGAVYYDWWLAAVASCNGRIGHLSAILVWHRMHDSNATGAAKPKIKLYKQVMTIVPKLMTIKKMSEADKKFASQLLAHFSVLADKKFSWPLFMFLLKNAKVLFAHKKRIFPWVSYLKHAWRGSFSSTYV